MSANATIVYPVYYRLIVRRNKSWYFTKGEPFVNLFNVPWLEQEDLFSLFDISMKQVANELRCINGGKQGYYIANILDKKYYYCGSEWQDVKNKLRELGIGKDNPIVK
ncbi:hypothetical protein Riv7116_5566 [Rivularia sp. PCC 7116]|uniref:hypothetical protein n=1 Tax=Rivularia sp. PCC 7116 TaxID=373994 RepID=UPI00029EDF4D|nr:hypothetical protein [Rivularia sp. PCC 7116]AFY57935.1 hypothetical protein Riv7116_5566 [Rivularia sp. PCC 7116]